MTTGFVQKWFTPKSLAVYQWPFLDASYRATRTRLLHITMAVRRPAARIRRLPKFLRKFLLKDDRWR